jgi:hypothetical protein
MKKPTKKQAAALAICDHRAHARKYSEYGLTALAMATNYAGHADTPYRYSIAALARFQALAIEFAGLIETGEIADYSEHDAAFDWFMKLAIVGTNLPETKK